MTTFGEIMSYKDEMHGTSDPFDLNTKGTVLVFVVGLDQFLFTLNTFIPCNLWHF